MERLISAARYASQLSGDFENRSVELSLDPLGVFVRIKNLRKVKGDNVAVKLVSWVDIQQAKIEILQLEIDKLLQLVK